MQSATARPQGASATTFLQPVLAAARQAGIAANDVLAPTGLRAESLSDPELSVSGPALVRAIERAAHLSGDRAFGLHMGELAHVGTYGLLDYVLMSAPTLGDALQLLVRHYRVASDGADLTLEKDGPDVRVLHRARLDGSDGVRHANESFFAAGMVRLRAVLGCTWAPRAVRFAHARPGDTHEHERVFRGQVRFAEPVDALVLDVRDLATPLPTSDPGLHDVLLRHAEELARDGCAEPTWVAHVRNAIASDLRNGAPTIQRVAHRLALSVRTLQRRLEEDGINFRRLIEDCRREHALRLLEDPRLALADVARRVGFARPSALRRAQRRWMAGGLLP